MTIILLTLDGLVLATILALWFSTKLVTARAKTLPEATVRLLYNLARRLNALAAALDSGILTCREFAQEPIRPRAELERELQAARKIREIGSGEEAS